MRSRLSMRAFLGFTIMTLFVCVRAYSMSVVDYYNLLPGEFLSAQKYTLVQRGGTWAVKEEPGYGSIGDPVVDVRNGYIRTVYHGGDGDDERIVALFIMADKTPVMGIYSSYNGTGGEYGIQFCEYRKGAWKDVTGRVLPKMSYRDFLKSGYDTAPFEGVMKRVNGKNGRFVEPQFIVNLPRHGTIVTVGLHLKALRGTDVTDKDLAIVEKVRANQAFRLIELKWNMEMGVFEMGKKR